MTILVDTREQKADHIIGYFDRKSVNHKKKALNYGDYSFLIPANEKLGIQRDMYFDSKVCVERKGSLEEISGNLSKDRARFEKELSLAPETKVILLENANYSDIADGNYNTQYNKKSFIGSLHSFGLNTMCRYSSCQIINILGCLFDCILNITLKII